MYENKALKCVKIEQKNCAEIERVKCTKSRFFIDTFNGVHYSISMVNVVTYGQGNFLTVFKALGQSNLYVLKGYFILNLR